MRVPAPAGPRTVLLRPEQLRISGNGGGVAATVVRHDFHGHDALVQLQLADGTRVTARVLDTTPAVTTGDRVTVTVSE